ncbi:WD domain, G-beta repeat [Rhizoctonia solani]|uniref:WD domain, G-beta repeat n=1 Tax=Rhizoctonia solani TaxID=456999 RepID=A0A8H7M511_9AGAM|nr:WD domain, G-beta repeat [Rhizoctonia solani]
MTQIKQHYLQLRSNSTEVTPPTVCYRDLSNLLKQREVQPSKCTGFSAPGVEVETQEAATAATTNSKDPAVMELSDEANKWEEEWELDAIIEQPGPGSKYSFEIGELDGIDLSSQVLLDLLSDDPVKGVNIGSAGKRKEILSVPYNLGVVRLSSTLLSPQRMETKQTRSGPKPMGDTIRTFFPCFGRRAKPDAEIRVCDRGSSEPVELVDVEANLSAAAKSGPNWSLLDTVLAGLENAVEVFPPLQAALGGLREVVGNTKVSERNRTEYEQLASELQAQVRVLIDHVGSANPTWMPHSISKIAYLIQAEIELIKTQQEKGKISRIRNALDEETEIQSYRKVDSLFRQLQSEVSFSTWRSVQDQHMTSLLLPAPNAWYDAALSAEAYRGGCTPGTRKRIIDDFLDWANSTDTFRLYWMNGMPGTGKTTIAYTLCQQLESTKQLGACFFCSRISPDCRDLNRIFPTIAHQLAQYSNPYRNKLFEVLSETRNIAQRNINVQFENLILKPLASVKKVLQCDVVVVIDALDECSDGGEQVLALLVKSAAQLPVKFMVTSRPDPSISRQMDIARASSTHQVFYLHEIERSLVQDDVTIYLRQAFEQNAIPASAQDIEQLARYAGNLFIVAATTIRYIIGNGSMLATSHSLERMGAVLKMIETGSGAKTAYEVIDSLYRGILEGLLQKLESNEKDDVCRVLWATLCIREPVSVSTLSAVIGMQASTVESIVKLLQSVLYLSNSTGIVSTLHSSFPDFMFSQDRAAHLHCDRNVQDDILSRSCFSLMEGQLRFNICGLETSYRRDMDVPGLQNRVDECEDMDEDTETTNLQNAVHDAQRLVISFSASPAIKSMPHLYLSLLPAAFKDSELLGYHHKRFRGLSDTLTGHASDTRGRNDALVTWSVGPIGVNTEVSRDGARIASYGTGGNIQVWDIRRGEVVLDLVGGHPQVRRWDHLHMGHYQRGLLTTTIHHHSKTISKLAFSPSDSMLASASFDGTICLWNLRPTEQPSIQFEYRGGDWDVCFSPDGTLLASAGYGRVIRIRSTQTGALLINPLQGHHAAIGSVRFSPDGQRLASSSQDMSIRMWSPHDGTLLAGPFHMSMDPHDFQPISFSPDPQGSLLACAMSDATIQIINSHTASSHMPTYRPHCAINRTQYVHQLGAVSPDGTLIVSGSDDMSICIWDTASGALIRQIPHAHDGDIECVAFSLDGAKIASGSTDCNIRMWDPYSGEPMGGLLTGHTDWVWAVSFSSMDAHLFRVWRSDHPNMGPAERRAVELDLDEQEAHRPRNDREVLTQRSFCCLWLGRWHDIAVDVSGGNIAGALCRSFDSTIAIWDVDTRSLKQFEGYSGVMSVALTPDGRYVIAGSEDASIHKRDTTAIQNSTSEETSWVARKTDG